MIVQDIWEIKYVQWFFFLPGHQEPGYEANEWTAELAPFLIFKPQNNIIQTSHLHDSFLQGNLNCRHNSPTQLYHWLK